MKIKTSPIVCSFGLCLLLGCLLLAGCTAAESTAEPVQDTPSVAEPAPTEKTDTPSEEPDGTPVPAVSFQS